ncbi:MAG: hypothetical protein J2P37_12300, partial [Ktedonobacteraceae bacterium]|nr:hypothetical protein [Ktedonobacteraceae bacterium]
MSSTPLATAWPWTLYPSQMLQALAGSHPDASMAPFLLATTFAGLVGAYAVAMFAFYRSSQKHPTASRWLLPILGGVLLFGMTLLLQPLLFSDDVWTHIFSGRILSVHGANPLSTPPDRFANDPFLQWVLSTRDKPNIFGPFFLYIAALLAKVSSDPIVNLLLFKGVALLTHFICCILIWSILGIIAPQRRLSGTLLYAWNPLVLIELAGNGHNEGILLCLLLLAT